MIRPASLIPEHLAEIDSIQLLSGGHEPDHQFCALELLAYLAGEKHSAHPRCASDVLGAFVRPVNDWMTDKERQQLKPYVVRMFGTVGTRTQEQQRAFMLADWAIHFAAPMALRARGLTARADTLAALPAVSNKATARAAADTAAYAARAAASAAARQEIIASTLGLLDKLIDVTNAPELQAARGEA